MKLKQIFALSLAVILALSAVFVFAFAKRFKIEDDDQNILIYASSYLVYALGSMIVKDIPGVELHLLLQPQDSGLKNYTLSDWDTALISNCGVLLLNGGGYEGFESSVNTGDTAVMSLMSGLKYSVDDVVIADYTGSESDTLNDPWLFMYTDGAKQIAEAITANMLAIDELYTDLYYKNLAAAEEKLNETASEIAQMRIDAAIPAAAAHEAFYYTAMETGLDCRLILRRLPAQEHSEDEMHEMLCALKDAGITVLLIEEQAPAGFVSYMEDGGITVIKLDLYTSHTEKEGSEEYHSVLIENAKRIRENLN